MIAHLEEQIASARRLLGSILEQGTAIREQDVEGVVARLADIKTEMDLRARASRAARTDLLDRAGTRLGVPPAAVTLDALTTLMARSRPPRARERSAELRGLLDEIAREHGINRALMRQELSFLDHLMRLVGQRARQRATRPAAPPSRRPAPRHAPRPRPPGVEP